MDDPPELVALLLASGRGDEGAFARLYELTAPKLYSLCLRMLRNRAQAEEVLQEAYIKVWHHADDYLPDRGAPLAWIASICRNKCIDALRRERGAGVQLDPEAIDAVASDDPGPLDLTLQHGDSTALQECLAALTADQRQCILLAYFSGLTHQELGVRLKKPIGTVKSWVRRGLESLKRCLQS